MTFNGKRGFYASGSGVWGNFDHSNKSFSEALQVNLETYAYFGISQIAVDAALGVWQWIADSATDYLNNLLQVSSDPGGEAQFYDWITMDARAEWESAKRGAIDGFLESTGLDYFVGGTYGPIEGHEQAYSKGYAVGMAAGIGVTIAAGFVTGGATIGACTANIARIGVTAARVFNMAGMIGGVGKAADKIQDMSKNGFTVGGVASVALDLLPAASAGIGKIAKMAGKAEWLNFGGCFVAGTLVRVEAAGVSSQVSGVRYPASEMDFEGASHEQSGLTQEHGWSASSAMNTTLAPFAPLREEDHHHTLAPFAPLRGEGLGMRGDGKFEAGSGKFESSALDQALMDYEADAVEDFLFTTQASNLLPIEAVPLGSRIATKNPRDWEVQPSVGVAGEDWYEIHATIVRSDGNRVEVELLRPESWVREEGIELGGELWLHHPIRSLLPSPRLRGEGSGVRSLLRDFV